MQNLIAGETYIATLNNAYFENEKSVLKYIQPHEEWEDVFQFVVVERKQWPNHFIRGELAFPEGECVWREGEIVDLGVGGYTFELVTFSLENE